VMSDDVVMTRIIAKALAQKGLPNLFGIRTNIHWRVACGVKES
jgi:hypothetical protein